MSVKKILKKTIFFDIETVSGHSNYDELPDELKNLYEHKARITLRHKSDTITESDIVEHYTDRAGIFAEFGKIVCISIGYFHQLDDDEMEFRVKSFYGDDEHTLISEFANALSTFEKNGINQLCGHNIKEFDIPYICRRMVIHNIPLPNSFQITNKKPWELTHIHDTMALWKFGDYKNFTSLKLLTTILGIPTPKDDIDGSEVGKTYWIDSNLERIMEYCQKDVIASARLFMRLNSVKYFKDNQVVYK